MAVTAPFAAWYLQYRPDARKVALALVPADAAEDIVAEAFTRVLAAYRRGGGPAGAFRPYLLAAVRNLARDWNAERRRVVPVVVPAPRAAPAAEQVAARREELRMVERAFGSLPRRWRAVLWQTEVEGKAPAELAQESGMTPGAVAALAFRAREGLALAWQRERGDQERLTGPLPALQRLARKNPARSLDTSQEPRLVCRYAGRALRPDLG